MTTESTSADDATRRDGSRLSEGLGPTPRCPECNDTGERDSGGTHPWGEPIYLACDCKDAEIGRQWRENSSLEKWFPLTAERLAALEQWARDCRDQVLYPAAQREDAIGKAADGLGQALVEFRLGPNARVQPLP